MPFSEDMSIWFDAGGFAWDAVWTPAAGGGPFTIQVIFDSDYEHFQIGEAGQAGADQRIIVRDDQVNQGSGLARGDQIVFDGVTYKAGVIEPPMNRKASEGIRYVTLRNTS